MNVGRDHIIKGLKIFLNQNVNWSYPYHRHFSKSSLQDVSQFFQFLATDIPKSCHLKRASWIALKACSPRYDRQIMTFFRNRTKCQNFYSGSSSAESSIMSSEGPLDPPAGAG